MDRTQSTFSEHWHRVANQRIWLLPGVRVRRQYFRGELWHVLEHPFANRFFRLRPAAYYFIARLCPQLTVDEAWKATLDAHPDEAPGQEAVVQLLAQLYAANLIHYPKAEDASALFERFRKRKQREWRSNWLNIMFLRLPLWDPDAFLARTLPLLRPLFSWFGIVFWLLIVGSGIKTAIDHSGELWQQTQGLLDHENLPWLYLSLVGLKLIHELGHAYTCRHFGGEVHTIGVMLMIFTPVPYVDATSSWGFRKRSRRILVGAAGMIVELFVAAVAAMVWAKTGAGVLHSVTYNVMFIASVSTLVFNLNPLLRFDGYYILSDLLEIPNLQQRANQLLTESLERVLFKLTPQRPLAASKSERAWLTLYGISSHIYRVIVFAGILLFVADRFLIIGLLIALSGLIAWLFVPVIKLLRYLFTSPKLVRCRPRAIGVSAGIIGGLIVVLAMVPFPASFRASGVVEAKQFSEAVAEVDGQVAEILVQSGSPVRQGDSLVRMINPELELRYQQVMAQKEETTARLRQAQQIETANLKPLQQRLDTVEQLLAQIQHDRSNLVVRARHDGWWTAPNLHEHSASWIAHGTSLGLVLDPAGFDFVAAVDQSNGDALFSRKMRGAEIRLRGQSGRILKSNQWEVVPGEQSVLPSAALGWKAGGELAVQNDDPSGRRTLEPFFQLRLHLGVGNHDALWHGRRGIARVTLPSEPLGPRMVRHIQQLIQKRYGL